MFEQRAEVLTTADLAAVIGALGRLDPDVDDRARIDQIRLLEQLKSAASAAQAVVTAEFAASQRAEQLAIGVPAERASRGIAAQVGLARRISPFNASRYTGWARILTTELPRTLRALQAGRTSEWRAMIVARETAWLCREDRTLVDTELAGKLEQWGDRRVEAEVKKIAYRLDPHGYVNRTRGANSDRCVSLRPAPDTMSRLTGFLPVAQGVAAYAALIQHADSLIAQGDPRGRGQIMADTMVERLTGQAAASNVPVEVNLVMTDQALLNASEAGSDEPAVLVGCGPIPAPLARQLITDRDEDTATFIRRLYADPTTGQLATMDATRRIFTANQRRFLILRDQYCRTPWCEAPIRHSDHVIDHDRGGPTTITNGQGLCAACNHAKQAPGWNARPGPYAEVTTTTPTGHRYRSRPPDLPGARPIRVQSRTECTFLIHLEAA